MCRALSAKFGVPPERIVDYLTLVGDSVDNVPGVEKVGPKTAAKWLQTYGSLDALVATRRPDHRRGRRKPAQGAAVAADGAHAGHDQDRLRPFRRMSRRSLRLRCATRTRRACASSTSATSSRRGCGRWMPVRRRPRPSAAAAMRRARARDWHRVRNGHDPRRSSTHGCSASVPPTSPASTPRPRRSIRWRRGWSAFRCRSSR